MSGRDLREDAVSIFRAGLEAANPVAAVERHVDVEGDILRVGQVPYPLDSFAGIYVVGMGKASALMAKPLLDHLGDRVMGGIINVKYGHRYPLGGIRVVEAGHPVPDDEGLRGTREMMRLLEGTGLRDLVFCLLSGGGSALAPAPAEGLSLGHKREVTRMLLECGAPIHEINSIRKHLSGIKGGRLARLAQPSRVISLVLSDVIGNDLSTIASGPTVPDPSTFYDCLRILTRFNLVDAVPHVVLKHLERGARGEISDTPKGDDPAFLRTQNLIVGSNALALAAARETAAGLGYNALILSSSVSGETREVARVHAAIGREVAETGSPVPPPACIISGGETTVTVRGKGKGGRNQEFVLAAALDMEGVEDTVVLSCGTDGTDGPTDAAGAVADGQTVERGRRAGLDARRHLENNDAYPFFQALEDLIITGPTLTNVMDLRLILIGPPGSTPRIGEGPPDSLEPPSGPE